MARNMKKKSTAKNHKSPIKRVLIVEDSFTVRKYLQSIIDSDPGLEVVGLAVDGEEGVRLAKRKRPDIVTMDIHMPQMDGYEATQRIMRECPVPIVVVTSIWDPGDVRNSFRAIDAGALVSIEKPPGPGHPESKLLVAKLLRTIKTMSEVRVIRRTRPGMKQGGTPRVPRVAEPAVIRQGVEVVAIGASTGGPPVIKDILSGLGPKFSVPILIAQHIAPGFLDGMVGWLDRKSGLSVRVASDKQMIEKGNVYFAPDGHHMGVTAGGRIVFNEGAAENGVRPSVSHLFRSVTRTYGKRGAGVLLTGMGKDGAVELAEMRERGAVTVAQNKESCVIYGMPAEAVKLNGATHVLPPEEIIGLLDSIGGR